MIDLMDWRWDLGSPHMACRGEGCEVCERSGRCPGCGKRWDLRHATIPATDAAEMGRVPLACRTCGRLARWSEIAGFWGIA